MKKVLFINKECILLSDNKKDNDTIPEFYPGVFHFLSRIVHELDFELISITSSENKISDNKYIVRTLENEGIKFSGNIAVNDSDTNLNTQFTDFLDEKTDLLNSCIITTIENDLMMSASLGCRSVLINGNGNTSATFNAANWDDVYQYLKKQPRITTVSRATSETSINITLNLDGNGKATISTGLGFFDHMLEQIARHGNFDLSISVTGDLHIDEHHTIEDVGLVLGDAFLQALSNKKGIRRYGFLLPMDDCLAQVAIDFGGRPWLVWDAQFNREKIGEMPTEMFPHFFKSFTDTAKCNLNIKAEGSNEHHKIESVFKAFAKSLAYAVKQTDNYNIPSTKGKL